MGGIAYGFSTNNHCFVYISQTINLSTMPYNINFSDCTRELDNSHLYNVVGVCLIILLIPFLFHADHDFNKHKPLPVLVLVALLCRYNL